MAILKAENTRLRTPLAPDTAQARTDTEQQMQALKGVPRNERRGASHP